MIATEQLSTVDPSITIRGQAPSTVTSGPLSIVDSAPQKGAEALSDSEAGLVYTITFIIPVKYSELNTSELAAMEADFCSYLAAKDPIFLGAECAASASASASRRYRAVGDVLMTVTLKRGITALQANSASEILAILIQTKQVFATGKGGRKVAIASAPAMAAVQNSPADSTTAAITTAITTGVSTGGSNSTDGPNVVGIIVGVIVALVLLAGLFAYAVHSKKDQDGPNETRASAPYENSAEPQLTVQAKRSPHIVFENPVYDAEPVQQEFAVDGYLDVEPTQLCSAQVKGEACGKSLASGSRFCAKHTCTEDGCNKKKKGKNDVCKSHSNV